MKRTFQRVYRALSESSARSFLLSCAILVPVASRGQSFSLSDGFSAGSNPNGAWACGWSTTVGGNFTALTVPWVSTADAGVRVPSWQLTSGQTPAVYKNTANRTITVGGGIASFPAGTLWFYPGDAGGAENFGVIRFKLPGGLAGSYTLHAQVAPVYPSSPQGDTDFHVVANGTELFSRNLAPTESATFDTVISLVDGGTVDFAVGRGSDGSLYGSGLRIAASLVNTTNTPPPPPPPTDGYDLSSGFAAGNNPNGPWAYGWSGTVGGSFTALTVPWVSGADGGVPVPSWQLTSGQTPAVYKNTADQTISVGGGLASYPAGTVWFYPGENGRPENFGVIRFKLPAGQAGNYAVHTKVAPVYPGSPQGDTDFHVVANGAEVFGRNLAPADSATFDAVVSLTEGSTVDFVIGRGSDRNLYGSGLQIAANLVKTTNGPTPPPPPPATDSYDLSSGFAAGNNPNGPWAYGWSGTVGGSFTALTVPWVSRADRGVAVPSWQLTSGQTPAVYKNTANQTISVGGGLASYPAGTVWFYPGENGRPESFGVIRFKVPAGQAGNYAVHAKVAPVYPGSPQGDTDFHVVASGTEVFGRNLVPADSATFDAVISLTEGGTVDFVIGRGSDGNLYGSGLQIAASLLRTTNAPPPPTVNHRPEAKLAISPVFPRLFDDETDRIVVAVNHRDVVLHLDGTGSVDPDGDVLEFSWVLDRVPLRNYSQAIATNVFELGEHEVTVIVADASAIGAHTLSFEVVTPAEALQVVEDFLASSDAPRRAKRPCLATLEEARHVLERGRTQRAVQLLESFRWKVRSHFGSLDQDLSSRLLAAADFLIGELEAKPSKDHNDGKD